MGWFRRSANERRERALRTLAKGAPSPLTAYLSVPFPEETSALEDVEFLAVDFETTGLDPDKDHVLAVGFVPVIGGRVVLAGARSLLVAAEAEVGASATVHGLTDDDVATGVPLEEAITEVLAALTGRVLLAHFTKLEQGFLRAACASLWGGPFECQRVDTMELQRRLVDPPFGQDLKPGALRLWASRARYGLPVYRAHEPLVDALSCAELFLAETAEMSVDASTSLKRVLS